MSNWAPHRSKSSLNNHLQPYRRFSVLSPTSRPAHGNMSGEILHCSSAKAKIPASDNPCSGVDRSVARLLTDDQCYPMAPGSVAGSISRPGGFVTWLIDEVALHSSYDSNRLKTKNTAARAAALWPARRSAACRQRALRRSANPLPSAAGSR